MVVEVVSGGGGVNEDKDHLKPLSPPTEPSGVGTCQSNLSFYMTPPFLRGCCSCGCTVLHSE